MTISGHLNTTNAIVEQIKRRGDVKHIHNATTEVVPQSLLDRIARLEKLFESFEGSQAFVQPRAFQELWERVNRLEQDPQTFVAAEPAELRDDIREMAKNVAAIGSASLGQLESVGERLARVEGQLTAFFETIERG